jgi:hypothetical protein
LDKVISKHTKEWAEYKILEEKKPAGKPDKARDEALKNLI